MKTSFIDQTCPFLVLIGPSGSGKSRLAKKLEQNGVIELNRSWTTRPMRQDESNDGSEHIHISKHEFEAKIAENFFLEYVSLFGLPHYYGMPKLEHKDARKLPCVIMRSMVLPLLQKHYKNYVVYQLEIQQADAMTRLSKRGDSKDEITGRLRTFTEEIKQGRDQAKRTFQAKQNSLSLYTKILDAIRIDFSG